LFVPWVVSSSRANLEFEWGRILKPRARSRPPGNGGLEKIPKSHILGAPMGLGGKTKKSPREGQVKRTKARTSTWGTTGGQVAVKTGKKKKKGGEQGGFNKGKPHWDFGEPMPGGGWEFKKKKNPPPTCRGL